MVWRCLCIQPSRCWWESCRRPRHHSQCSPLKDEPTALPVWASGWEGWAASTREESHLPPHGAAGVSQQGHDNWAASASPSLQPMGLQGHPLPPTRELLFPPELAAVLLLNLRSLTRGGATFLSACCASRMNQHCLQGWRSAAWHVKPWRCVTCSPGSLLWPVKVSRSCRGSPTLLQKHLPAGARRKALCAPVREGGRAWLTLFWVFKSVPLVPSTTERYIFMMSGMAPLFQLLPRPSCCRRLKRDERAVTCLTNRTQRWGWVDCSTQAEIQICWSKGKPGGLHRAVQESPWKWPGWYLN